MEQPQQQSIKCKDSFKNYSVFNFMSKGENGLLWVSGGELKNRVILTN